MQAQAHVPNSAVLGQVPPRMAQQNGSSMPMQSAGAVGGSGWRRTWQTDADMGLRRAVEEDIMRLFAKRKPLYNNEEWSQKLPDFVHRLEEALYRVAQSKDEYQNQQTLESRLQHVAKRLSTRSQNAQQHAPQMMTGSSLGNMMPTPGTTMIPTPGNPLPVPGGASGMMPTPGVAGNMVPTPGTVSSMIPTPGALSGMMPTPGHGKSMLPNVNNMMPSKVGKMNGGMMMAPGSGMHSLFSNAGNMMPTPGPSGNSMVSAQGMGGMRMAQNGNLGMNMGMPAGGSQMIPTPGLTPTQGIGMNQNSSLGVAQPNVTAAQLQRQPSFGAGPGSQLYRNLNGQIGNVPNNIVQRKNVMASANGMSNGMQMMGNSQQQQLINGSASIHGQTNYLNSNQLSSSTQQQQQHQQQHQLQRSNQRQYQLRMQSTAMNSLGSMSEGYAMNAADLAGGLPANNFSMSASVSQPAKMIPVPGLPGPQQSSLNMQQGGQPQQGQRGSLSQNSGRSHQQQQQQMQIQKGQSLYQSTPTPNVSSQKLVAGSLPQDQTQQQSPVQKMPLPMGISHFDAQPPSPQLQRQRPVSLQQQQMSIQSLQQQQRQGTLQQQTHVPHSQQAQHEGLQVQPNLSDQLHQGHHAAYPPQLQPAAQQSRTQQDAQQRSFSQSQQQQRQAIQLSQVQQDQQQSLPSPQSNHLQQPPRAASANGSSVLTQSAPRLNSVANGNLTPAAQLHRQQQYSKQQRWLLFLRHASKCGAPERQCNVSPHCHVTRLLAAHITSCREPDCQYNRCNASRSLLSHFRHCADPHCPVCVPVKQVLQQKRPLSSLNQSSPAAMSPSSFSASTLTPPVSGGTPPVVPTSASAAAVDSEFQQPPAKRVKVETGSSNGSTSPQPPHLQSDYKGQSAPQTPGQQQSANRHVAGVRAETLSGPKTDGAGVGVLKMEAHSNAVHQRKTQVKVETVHVKVETHVAHVPSVKLDAVSGGASAHPPLKQDTGPAAKPGKPKIVGTSLTELFTPEMIREHITGLRQWVGQSKAKAEKHMAMEHQMSDNACRLCAVERLTFEPPPIYCTACGVRIKRNAFYHTKGFGEARHHFCVPCYNDIRTEQVDMDGMTYPKTKLEKRRNDEETEEAWVQCDKCNQWNHQVCALFNGRRNEGGEAEYTCPQCCMSEIEGGERKPLSTSAVLGANDLPKTSLSDHLEKRLAWKLKDERAERARALGKSIDEVPGADSLVVRVVSSVDKKLEVKQRFMEIFQEEEYPTEFPYKSKVVLLFQKIEGVEVCLFGMYVQEFGVDCQHPNQRRVYLSYLDSVKYFRPDVRTVHGEALRTYVYHEILIAYLEYCKLRGFSSCYIWACPPLKGEDYILYCHPEIQKTPKSDKLRDWYLTMLKKATMDGIVVEVTNLYDYFFVSTGEAKAKVTAARLPYFDGDYWPGAAEDMIVQLQQEEEDGRKLQKKGKNKKTATKRASKAAAQVELASNASKDLQLMHKLGESILPMKEDFIMVHMHHACTHCCLFIVSGSRWTCKQCKNFQLCDRCHDAEQKRDERDRHPISIKESHALTPIPVDDVPQETKDKDEFMESEFFDTRQAFLSLCQGNHYQYDTLRRAKHSSMMVLYHLHNPAAPAFVITCNHCHHDIETGAGWRCETCPDFDLCNACKGLVEHPHKLTPHPSASERTAQNKEARQQRVIQLRNMLDVLVHASKCGVTQCSYPKCRSVKSLFRHGMQCRVRASGGCNLCKRMWYLLQIHARACKESECRVPRCKDLKEHGRRATQQQESRRRAAVMEMMRQRAAETAGGLT